MLAAIDLGSNSFRLHIGKHVENTIRIIESAKEPNRLAAGLDQNNYLTPIAIDNGLNALYNIRRHLHPYPIRKLRAVATHTLRIAKNATDFLSRAEKILEHPIDLISGVEEGQLIYLGIENLLSKPKEKRLVIDIGGGSTEVIYGKGNLIKKAESFSIGTVKQSQLFPPDNITQESFNTAVKSACQYFNNIKLHYQPYQWEAAYGSSGTIRAIAEIIANNKIGNGQFNAENLDKLRKKIISKRKINQINFSEIQTHRITSVIGGISIMIALTKKLNIPLITPIQSGLRMGVLWDLHKKFGN